MEKEPHMNTRVTSATGGIPLDPMGVASPSPPLESPGNQHLPLHHAQPTLAPTYQESQSYLQQRQYPQNPNQAQSPPPQVVYQHPNQPTLTEFSQHQQQPQYVQQQYQQTPQQLHPQQQQYQQTPQQLHPQQEQYQQTTPHSYPQQQAYQHTPQQPQLYQQQFQQAPLQRGAAPVDGRPRYVNAVPISSLNMGPAPVDCPICQQRSLTNTVYVAGNTTHMWALATCLLTWCLCFIPYMMNSLKDCQHRCGNCGVLLATWHKSGQVEVHAH